MEKNNVVLYKAGNFYSAFGDDGLLLHHLLGYRYIEYKHSVGFPETAYSKVINKLQNESLSYQVYDKSILLEEYKGLAKNYIKMLKEALKEYDIEKRMERLKNKLNDFSIDELEKIIEGIESGSS